METYEQYSLEELKQCCREAGIRAAGKRETLIRKLLERQQRDDERFRINVRTLIGRVSTVYCQSTTTIPELKLMISAADGIPPEQMNLFLVCYSEPGIGDMIYPDGSIAKKITDGTLEEVGAASGSTVLLQLRLRA